MSEGLENEDDGNKKPLVFLFLCINKQRKEKKTIRDAK